MYTTRRGRYLISCPTVRTSQTSSLPSYNILAQNATNGKRFFADFRASFHAGAPQIVEVTRTHCMRRIRRPGGPLTAAAEGNEIQRGRICSAHGEHLRQKHMKCAATALNRLDPDPTAMLRHNVLADRQPQPR